MEDKNTDSVLKTQHNKRYNLDFKKEVIDYAEIHGNRPASRRFEVDEKRVREWRTNKYSIICLLETDNGKERSRLIGGGRKPFSAELEEILLEWIDDQKSGGVELSSKLIMKQAEVIYRQMSKGNNVEAGLKAAKGWLCRFLKRNGLSLRQKTSIAKKDSDG